MKAQIEENASDVIHDREMKSNSHIRTRLTQPHKHRHVTKFTKNTKGLEQKKGINSLTR